MRALAAGLWLAVVVCSLHAELLHSSDLEYLGAFRLPDEGDYGWNWSGFAATFYPDGDPSGPVDGVPGSIFALGHNQLQLVSEISIPVPVISPTKNLDDLNTAATLQPFADIPGGMFGNLEVPQAGLAYLPAQGGQATGKIHFCWSQHFQEFVPTHGWCELSLSSPLPAGPWRMAGYTPYATADYLFDIPEAWAGANTPGRLLATGRFREGFWSGLGPALFAYGPWNEGNPPLPGATLTQVTPLLLYGIQQPGIPEILTADSMAMRTFNPDDDWSGGAWLTAGDKAAVAFVGTKGMGSWWYGFMDGTVWPDEPPYPPVPPWPYDDRGYWSDSVKTQILFLDPEELGAVARGEQPTWAPQPYDSLDIDVVMFDAERDAYRDKYSLVGAMCFDRQHGILYLLEHRADGEQCLVHAWRVSSPLGSTTLSIELVTPTAARLFWIAVPGAAYYDLYRSTASQFEAVGVPWHIAVAPDTSFQFSEGIADPGDSFFYRAGVRNGDAASPPSNAVGECEFSLSAPPDRPDGARGD
ncbi:MAG: hypothetical protein MUE60_07625 [Candidatus Eisenbacteria bacterium]|jgi:hypothetical protein|nr:hypothetical protein [Candidatus Eisenbacteria bacterium]